MYSSTILLATLAATVSATIPLHKRYVEARQTDASSSSGDEPTASETINAACASAADDIESIISGAPVAPDDLYSYAATATEFLTEDPCSYTFPASLESEWSSYTSAYYSWFDATASAELSSALSACQTTLDASDLGICSTDAGVAAGTGSASESASTIAATTTVTESSASASGLTTSTSGGGAVTKTTASGSSGTAKATTTSTAGAVARDAGLVGAVLAGFLGAAVVL